MGIDRGKILMMGITMMVDPLVNTMDTGSRGSPGRYDNQTRSSSLARTFQKSSPSRSDELEII